MRKRILWVNTLGSSEYDSPIADLLGQVKDPETEVEVVSLALPEPLAHVEYRSYEALTHGDIVRLAADGGHRGLDAMVIGCFFDPALKEAREVSGDMVVVGPCLAAVQLAATLADSFSIIVTRNKCARKTIERVQDYGASGHLASIRSLNIGVDSLRADPDLTMRRIKEEAHRAVDEDQAEVVVLGCTVEFGFHEEVQKETGVPVIDAVCAPFKLAEHLAGLKRRFGWVPSRVGSCEPPPAHEIERFGLFKTSPPVRNRIEV